MSKTVRAALYTRVSTRAQAEKHGTAYQREALERMADARGWTVVGTFADEGWSGRREDRPALDAMMRALRKGEIDVVAVWRWDRLARSLSHLVAILLELRARNVALASHQEGIDTNTPIGMAMFQIAGAMAELEANLARERVQAGLDAARARGVRVGRPRGALTVERAVAALGLHGSVRKAARALGVAPSMVARRVKEGAASVIPR